jgi:N-acetylglutamate synthase-like GNAT family acetyltransferase
VPEPTAIIDSIGVDPGVQGHHVGSALLDQLEMNLRGIGIAAVRTEVEWERKNLLHFFATHGFKPAPILCLQKRMAPES